MWRRKESARRGAPSEEEDSGRDGERIGDVDVLVQESGGKDFCQPNVWGQQSDGKDFCQRNVRERK